MACVVVADDVVPLHMLVRRALQADGHQLVEATDGDGALQQLGRQRPDMAILGLNGPDRIGPSRCPVMRADRAPRAVAMTVLSGQPMAGPAPEAGADACPEPPCRPAEGRDALARPVDAGPAAHAVDACSHDWH